MSLIETHRVGGKVRHEHVAGLGAIELPLTVAGRAEFWRRLYERLGELSNRLDAAAQVKALGEVHERVPMVTVEEIRALQLENAEADERLWRGFVEMQTEQAEGNRQLAAAAERAAAVAQGHADKAGAQAAAARDRVERMRRGEAVKGGLGKQLTREDIERILREAGWTTGKHAKLVTLIGELGRFEAYMAELHKRRPPVERALKRSAARAVLRRQLGDGR